MTHVVYYFSGTGNSLTVAKALEGKGAFVKSISTEILENKNNHRNMISCDADKVGIVFPLYYLGLPKIVHEFLNQLELPKATYVYMICTMGWTLKGGAISQVKQHLLSKNITLSMGSYIHMPMNDFTYSTVCKPEEQSKILNQFPKKMNKILDYIEQSKKHFDFEPIKFMVNKRNIPFCNEVSHTDQYFTVTDTCTSCGLCSQVCSVKNIALNNGKPEWKHNCESCLACFHYCPNHAIKYKEEKDINQYHHPLVTVNEHKKYR